MKKFFSVFVLTSILFSGFLLSASDYKLSVKVVIAPSKRAILSSRIFSTIEKFHVKEGETFKKGDLLAELDEKYYLESLNKAKAAVKAADNEIQFSTKNFNQGQRLYDGQNLSELELEQRRFEKTRAEIQKIQMVSDLEIARFNYDSCKISAPFSGRVVMHIVKEFEDLSSARTGKQVIEIINDKVLKVTMFLPSTEFSQIKLGDKISINISETGKIYSAKVVEKAAEMDALSRTFELRAELDNTNYELRAGMVGTLVE